MDNKCPHHEIKYFGLRELKMDSKGIGTRNAGWYCMWCKQEFIPVKGDEDNGSKSKASE
jgi:hypothetical protein